MEVQKLRENFSLNEILRKCQINTFFFSLEYLRSYLFQKNLKEEKSSAIELYADWLQIEKCINIIATVVTNTKKMKEKRMYFQILILYTFIFGPKKLFKPQKRL